MFDSLDGTVARLSGKSTLWGSFLDSTLDRVADASIFGALAVYFHLQGDTLGTVLSVAVVGAGLAGPVRPGQGRERGRGRRQRHRRAGRPARARHLRDLVDPGPRGARRRAPRRARAAAAGQPRDDRPAGRAGAPGGRPHAGPRTPRRRRTPPLGDAACPRAPAALADRACRCSRLREQLVSLAYGAAWRGVRLLPERTAYALGDRVADRVTARGGRGRAAAARQPRPRRPGRPARRAARPDPRGGAVVPALLGRRVPPAGLGRGPRGRTGAHRRRRPGPRGPGRRAAAWSARWATSATGTTPAPGRATGSPR